MQLDKVMALLLDHQCPTTEPDKHGYKWFRMELCCDVWWVRAKKRKDGSWKVSGVTRKPEFQ